MKFEGIITPTLTPFHENGEVWYEKIDTMMSYLSGAGIHGVFCVGSYGSFSLLSDEERKQVTKHMINASKKYGLHSIVHIGHASTKFSCELAKLAQDQGADAVAAVLPYYYSGHAYTDANYFPHFEAIRNSVDIDLHFYNNPRTTSVAITPQFLGGLKELGVTGMKDSGSNMDLFQKYAEAVWTDVDKSFDLMPGSGSVFLSGFEMGARACVAGTSMAFPEPVRELYDSIVGVKSTLDPKLCQEKVNSARDVQQSENMRPATAYDILKMRGIDLGYPRAPWRRLSDTENQAIYQKLRQLDMI